VRRGRSSSASPVAARCDDAYLDVTLADGRVLRAPPWWYPRLLAASADQRAAIEFSPLGLHWPEIDEDISVASILRGWKAPGAKRGAKARIPRIAEFGEFAMLTAHPTTRPGLK
jgi:hypothetical protein